MKFTELGLSEKVVQAVADAGYEIPTPIQAQAIPHVLARQDVLGIAQTGTGKTAAFTLPMLTVLEQGRARARMPRTLILEPTRELAAQVEENFVKYGANQKLSVALLIGGVSFGDQDVKITRGVDVLIATPGRLLDHYERGKLLLTGIEILVIDEADRMLDMGFIPDIERICKLTPFTRQTLFFTATMPPEIQRITEQFLSNPVKIEVARPATAAATITQRLVATGGRDFEKRDTLRRVLRDAEDLKNAIIFCNRKRDVAVVVKSLEKHGFNVGGLHGDMDQRARMATLDAFRAGRVPVLVASDVAARGLDIPDVSHVINFDVPIHADDYVHRIGRTGRAGRSGTSLTLVSRGDLKYLEAINRLTKVEIAWDGETLDEFSARETANGGPPPDREARGRDRDRPRGERGSRGERGARGERSQRGDRPPRRERGSADEARAPREEAAPPAADAYVREGEGSQRTERSARGPRPDRPEREPRQAPKDIAAAHSERRPPRRDDWHDRDDGPPVKGLGDHVPGFFMRPVRKG